MKENSFYIDVVKAIAVIISVILMCRFTLGGMAVMLALIGIIAAVMHKPAITACCFIVFPMMTLFNRAIVGLSGITLLVGRLSFALMVVALSLSGMIGVRMREKLPVKWIFLYIGVACLSSMDGWMPLISYLKIVNFSLMILGIYLLSKMIQTDIRSLYAVRVFFMAMSVIMIVLSLVVYFIPSIGFSMTLYRLASYGNLVTGEELMESGSKILFNGMTCHSQMLSPVVSCLGAWVVCDMLLIERRVVLFHCAILSCVPVLLYLSRSRGGLVMLASVVILIFFVTIPKARLAQHVKNRLGMIVMLAAVLLVGAGVYFECKNEALSRWVRKTDDVSSDGRTLKEAFTGSRQRLIENNLRDFYLNPLLGKGFQVVEGMDRAYATGEAAWFSASVEKGVTPFVILGETGIFGAAAFLFFLSSFYGTCFRRGYMSLMTNFTCFLVANLADSTLFSPSGMGGFMWIVACIGGFATDCYAKVKLEVSRSLRGRDFSRVERVERVIRGGWDFSRVERVDTCRGDESFGPCRTCRGG